MTREDFDTTLKDHLLSNRISASKELDLLLPSSTLVSICDYDAFLYQWKEERTRLEKERRKEFEESAENRYKNLAGGAADKRFSTYCFSL